jgi:excisionase family DNA binding protein
MTVWEFDPLDRLSSLGAEELRHIHLKYRDNDELGFVLWLAYETVRQLEDPSSGTRIAAQLGANGSSGSPVREVGGRILTVNDVASLIGTKDRNVTDLAKRGRLRGWKKAGEWRFTRDSVDEYLSERDGGDWC